MLLGPRERVSSHFMCRSECWPSFALEQAVSRRGPAPIQVSSITPRYETTSGSEVRRLVLPGMTGIRCEMIRPALAHLVLQLLMLRVQFPFDEETATRVKGRWSIVLASGVTLGPPPSGKSALSPSVQAGSRPNPATNKCLSLTKHIPVVS